MKQHLLLAKNYEQQGLFKKAEKEIDYCINNAKTDDNLG
jgi:hypothetical protein